MITLNNMTVTLKLARREVCELLLACDAMSVDSAKWIAIRDKMREQLDAFDAKVTGGRNNGRTRP